MMRAHLVVGFLALLAACDEQDEERPTRGRVQVPPATAPDADDDDDTVGKPASVGNAAPARSGRAEPDRPEPAPVHSGRGAQPAPTPGAPAAPLTGVKQVAPGQFTVSRDLVDTWKSSPGALGRAKQVEGGWQLSGIQKRAGYQLGMRNGDVITSVNGHELNTKMQQLGAWMALRNASSFQVEFLRGGQHLVYSYRIVE